jgi:predicted transcriptional regulator
MHFGMPATLSGAVEATNVGWAIALMDDEGTTTEVSQAGSLSLREFTVNSFGEFRVGVNSAPAQERETSESRPEHPPAFNLASAGPSSVYVEGRLTIDLNSVDGILQVPLGHCLTWILWPEDDNKTTRYDKLCPESGPAVLVRMNDESSFEFTGANVTRIQWHGMSASCSAEPCPPGGDREDISPSLPPPNYVRTRRYRFEDATGSNATVHTTGPASLVLFGGTLMDLQVNGWLRLPLASGTSACDSCLSPQDQTFFASGNLSLEGLSVGEDRRLQAHVDGDYTNVRFDEAAVDPALLKPVLTGAAVVVTTVAAAVLAKLALSALFTRRTEDVLLQNPRRRRLFEVVEQNPGIHLREALRLAELPSGSGRFHATQLVRNGLLAERRVGSTLRLFVAKLSAADDWAGRAALRNARFKPILEFLARHPGSSQKAVLDALRQALGWNPSTTQGRLSRLVADGVVNCAQQGRFKLYRLARPLAAPALHAAVTAAEAVQTSV